MKNQIILRLLLSICLFPFFGSAQLSVNSGLSAVQLAQILAGPNITINSATLTGGATASGSFDGTSSNLGMTGGVILSNGDVGGAPGPNNSNGGGDNLGQPGTAQMDSMAGALSYDAITLEFSFNVQSDFIQFQYIFASEEYPEYAPPNSSSFNDVFAFFISGPGIVGEENIALVPGTASSVSINNINAVTNNQYYIDNSGGATVQYDAWTTILTAERQGLVPCQEYTMKLVIADAGDPDWSSAVFLLENSFIQGVVDVNTQTVNADDIALEGCIPAQFNFSLDLASATATDISYQIGGSATNGIDYQFIDTLLTIPAGDTAASIIINAFSDGFPEGQESIYIIFQTDLCSPPDTAFLYIDDAQPIEFTLDETNLSCFDNSTGEILVNASGGFPPYTYQVTEDGGNGPMTQYATNPVTGLDAGVYSVQVYDIYGCKAEALVIGGIYDADTTFLPDGTGVSYTSTIPINGFDNGQTLDNMTQLQQICATMEHSYLGDLQIKVISPSGQEVILKEFNGGGSCDLGEPFASGPVDGSNSNLTDPGVGFEYCWNAAPIYLTMVQESNNYTHTIPSSTGGTYTDNFLPQGSYASFENLNALLGSDLNGNWNLEVSDQFNLDNGYIFSWNVSLVSDLPDTLVTITEPEEMAISGFIAQAQCGGTDGSIDLSVLGDYPPFTYAWSSGETTEDLTAIGAGTYTVTVTDANGCSDSATFNLNNISSLNITSNVTSVTCSGGLNGGIDVTTSGGTSPYMFAWNSGETTEDIGAIGAGLYTLTISDASGCQFSEDIAVSTLPGMSIALDGSTNEVCSFDNGSIDVSVIGGSGSYGYSWDNGANTEDLANIGSGTYTLTVTDANGCSENSAFSIINDVSNCSAYCYLNIATNQVSDESCGDGSGAIDITILDATSPYIVSWDNGSITDDISSLSAGTYTVTVLDANQCELIESFTVGNNAGTLEVSSSAASNENCGNSDGTIDIVTAGGISPYTYVWSNAATTEDITGLAAGNYDVTINDNAGCTINETFTVGNNVGAMSESAVVSSEICGNGGGTINLTVTGGVSPYSYSWSNGSTNEDQTLLSAGTYSVIITDGVGCSLNSVDYTVTNSPTDLTILSIDITNENCNDGAGAIDINVINGTQPYIYSWSNSDATEDITDLTAGVYGCVIVDNNGCQVETGDQTIFNQGGSLSVSTISVTDEVCGDATGQIDVDVIGGAAPYTFSWDNGATTEDITGLATGAYVITVIDANGCATSYTESIQDVSPGFSIALASVTDEVCGDGSGSINISTTGGTNPILYVWDNGATTEDISSLSAGTYNVIAIDNNGCELSASATIEGEGISVGAVSVSDEICGNASGAIDISFSGGVNPYGFSWSNGAITEDISGLSAGTYSLTITGAGGCSYSGSYSVGNNASGLSITSTTIIDESCGDGNGSINVSSTGGVLPLFYNWDNGAMTEDLSGLSAGTYMLIIEDANGCSVGTSGTVVNNAAGFAASISAVADETCGDASGAIDIDVSGGSLPYTYAWDSGETTEDISGVSGGIYQVTVSDNNSCTIELQGIVNNITG
ncbi:MAG: choice-of-anchor L domain-containing protein, partial [Flavobacteriales bacterium]|nr:choice-of-anchor L domain-containing protein [Flavobacteriales bacterium]